MSPAKDTPTPHKTDTTACYQPRIGETILNDRYEIREILGQGGMGQVYKAFDNILQRDVAIKFLTSGRLDGPAAQRFQLEAKATSALKNDGIVSIYDFGLIESGYPYMVMEFVTGMTLSQYLEENECLDLSQTLTFARQVCSAMAHAHNNKVVHRDLKPSNIVIGEIEGETIYKILDFGISKLNDDSDDDNFLTQTGQIIGSPRYLSPEQARGEFTDHRSDIYSLGCILFECLCGQTPFEGENVIETITMRLDGEAPKLSEIIPDKEIPAELDTMLVKCLKLDSDERFQTMEEVNDALYGIEKVVERQSSPGQLSKLKESIVKIHLTVPEREELTASGLSNVYKILLFVVMPLIVISLMVAAFLSPKEKPEHIKAKADSEKISSEKNDEIKFLRPYPDVLHVRSNQYLTGKVKGDALFKNIRKGTNLVSFKGFAFESGLIEKLSSYPLRKIEFTSCKLTPEELKELTDSRTLTNIIIYECGLNDSMIKHMQKMNNMKDLSVDLNPITGEGLEIICEKYPNLRLLDLSGTNIKNEDLMFLKKLKLLRVLKIPEITHIDKKGLIVLTKVHPNLETLDLGGTSIGDNDLTLLTKMKKLEELDLQGVDITDKGVAHIARIPNLKTLDLGHNDKLTIQSLYFLKKKRNLVVKVEHCSGMKSKDIESFISKYPNVKVQVPKDKSIEDYIKTYPKQ